MHAPSTRSNISTENIKSTFFSLISLSGYSKSSHTEFCFLKRTLRKLEIKVSSKNRKKKLNKKIEEKKFEFFLKIIIKTKDRKTQKLYFCFSISCCFVREIEFFFSGPSQPESALIGPINLHRPIGLAAPDQ